jgi:hypothetical protein
MANEEKTFRAPSGGMVREAAMEAAEAYAPDDLEQHAQAIMDAWTGRMKDLTDKYTRGAIARSSGKGVAEAEAEPWTPTPIPYPWWNIVVAGPYQPAPLPGGPFLPHKIFQPAEPAFVVGAVWMNPAPINWFPPGPAAATVMGAFNLTIRFETMNLSTVANGPDPAPVVMAPLGAWPGPSWFKPFFVPIGGGFFPAPPDGQPHLYEMNVTADVAGPVPQPFAGYSTWVFDPDLEPPIFPPFIPGVTQPPVFPAWQYDIPMRFLVYTA